MSLGDILSLAARRDFLSDLRGLPQRSLQLKGCSSLKQGRGGIDRRFIDELPVAGVPHVSPSVARRGNKRCRVILGFPAKSLPCRNTKVTPQTLGLVDLLFSVSVSTLAGSFARASSAIRRRTVRFQRGKQSRESSRTGLTVYPFCRTRLAPV